MEQYDDLYQRWRNNLYFASLLVASFTLFLQIIITFCFLEYVPGTIELPTSYYILLYIYLPSALNFSIVIVGGHIKDSDRFSDAFKNYSSILVLSTEFFVIACARNVFTFTITLFVIPIILTLMYSNKMMTNIVTMISFAYMLISSYVAVLGSRTRDLLYLIEMFIAFSLILGCYIITNLLTDIEIKKKEIIKDGAFKQLQFEELIKCDPLTGLHNMAAFYSKLEVMINKGVRPLTIAVIDIDNFKIVNDTWGHDKANEVLIYIAAQLQSCCTTLGSVFRYGGEEFTIIFPEVTIEEAKAMVETAQQNIYNYQFESMPGQVITFSCGIASYTADSFSAHDFFQIADKIMYKAKLSGKNRILVE